MNRDCAITQALKRQQITMFEQADKLGITAKVIHYDTGGDNGGISLSALGQYSRGESAMGLPVLLKLIGVVPDSLLSLLMPKGRVIVQAPEEIDHDDLAGVMVDYLAEKQKAHHPDSECGPAIGPKECNLLSRKVANLRAVA